MKSEHKKLTRLWMSGKATHKQISRCRELDRAAEITAGNSRGMLQHGNQPSPADQMKQARAARVMVEAQSVWNQKPTAMAAFLDIFHPELSRDAKRDLVADVKSK